MAAGDIYRLSREVTIDGEKHVNVWHFENISNADPEPEEAIIAHAQRQNPSLQNALAGFQTGFTTITWDQWVCQRISPDKGDPVIGSFVNSPPASGADTGTPTFTQARVELATALTSRSGRGRNFYGGIAEGNTTGNVLNATGVVLLNAIRDALIACWTEAGAEFIGFVIGVWSEKLQDFNAATSMSSAATLGTMRSRRAGRGI